MTRCFMALAIFVAGSFASAPGVINAASYVPLELEVYVAPDPASDFSNLKITLNIRDHQGQGVQLAWRADYSDSDMRSQIRNAQADGVEGDDVTFVAESDRFVSSILAPTTSDGVITIQYDFAPKGFEGDRAWHPTIEEDHLHFMGHTILPRLCLHGEWFDRCDEQKIINAHFDWSAFGGQAWTTWSPDGTDTSYHGPMRGLLEAIYAIGAFDQQPITVAAHQALDLSVTLVTHALSSDEKQATVEAVQSAMAAVLAFWRERPAEHVLVTLRKSLGDQNSETYSGFDANSSFALMIAADDLISSPAFKVLVAHEFTHFWIDAELFANPRGNRMFHEGFTEFVARQVVWRHGLMSFDEYREGTNDVLESYFSSWLHDAPEADLVEFNGTDVSYERGELLALSWAHHLAHKVEKNADLVTRSAFETFDLPIDRFIRSVIASTDGDGTLRPETAFAIADDFGLTIIREDIEALSEGDGRIDVANWFAPCTKLTSIKAERPDIGLNIFESFRQGAIVELNPNGPAARAGLQEGDRVRHLRFRGASESYWEVKREGLQLKFTYPNEAKTVLVPQFQGKGRAAKGDFCLGKQG